MSNTSVPSYLLYVLDLFLGHCWNTAVLRHPSAAPVVQLRAWKEKTTDKFNRYTWVSFQSPMRFLILLGKFHSIKATG